MGYNSTILVMNDALHRIAEDKEFGAKVQKAVLGFHVHKDWNGRNDISSGGHINAATVMSCQHADSFAALVVGANTFWDMGYAGTWNVHFRDNMAEEERKLYFLKNIANELGYRLVKKKK